MSLAEPLRGVDLDDLRESTRRILSAIGEDPEREGLADTPRRVAESLAYLTEG